MNILNLLHQADCGVLQWTFMQRERRLATAANTVAHRHWVFSGIEDTRVLQPQHSIVLAISLPTHPVFSDSGELAVTSRGFRLGIRTAGSTIDFLPVRGVGRHFATHQIFASHDIHALNGSQILHLAIWRAALAFRRWNRIVLCSLRHRLPCSHHRQRQTQYLQVHVAPTISWHPR